MDDTSGAIDAPQYLTVAQVADQLGVDRKSVLSWVSSGELPAFSASKSPYSKRPRWRIDSGALRGFAEKRAVRPTPTSPARRRPQRDFEQIV